MPPEKLKLITCSQMAPIGDTEIVFLRFGHPEKAFKDRGVIKPYTTPSGVAIFDVENEIV